MRIAFAGNPNSGKTTMYNALTGRNEHVGNWAGVTVEKKEGTIKKNFYDGSEELIAVDLPGAYSMSPFTSEESITSAYVKNEKPDVIINIVDASNLSRSLFFTTQILELGIPVVVALNKSDINKKKQTKIDVDALSKELGCPVILTVSTAGNHSDLAEVVKTAVSLAAAGVSGALTNTVLVMSLIYVCFKDEFALAKEISVDAVFGAILGIVAGNGIPEAIVGGLLTLLVGGALLRIKKN